MKTPKTIDMVTTNVGMTNPVDTPVADDLSAYSGLTPPDPPTPRPGPCVLVFFDYARADGSTGRSRLFVEHQVDIRTRVQITDLEAYIRASNPDVSHVAITGWRPLEG